MQVATNFKSANLLHFDIAASVLYLLAEPSTLEKARKIALELAKEGKDITHTKAKAINSCNQEEAQPNSLNSATISISAKSTEVNSLAPSHLFQSEEAILLSMGYHHPLGTYFYFCLAHRCTPSKHNLCVQTTRKSAAIMPLLQKSS